MLKKAQKLLSINKKGKFQNITSEPHFKILLHKIFLKYFLVITKFLILCLTRQYFFFISMRKNISTFCLLFNLSCQTASEIPNVFYEKCNALISQGRLEKVYLNVIHGNELPSQQGSRGHFEHLGRVQGQSVLLGSKLMLHTYSYPKIAKSHILIFRQFLTARKWALRIVEELSGFV